MNETVNDALLRRFLLGKVDDEVRQQIESLFLGDSGTRERLLAAEQDLIEDYLEDSLGTEEKEQFVLRYAQTPDQQRKLRIARSIKDWAVSQANTATALTTANEQSAELTAEARVEPAVWTRLRERVRLQPVFVVPIAAVAVLAVAFAIVSFNQWREEQRHFAIEQELARLNTPASLRELPAGLETLTLTTLTLRGSESSPELKRRADTQFLDIRMPWTKTDDYERYQASVRRIRDSNTFIIRDLRAIDGNESVIRLRLPAYILTRGTYEIQLTGILPNGSASSPEEYQFTVAE